MKRLLPLLLIWLACCGFTAGWQKPPLGTQLKKGHPYTMGLTSLWIMNEKSGNKIRDIIGKNHATMGSALSWGKNGVYSPGGANSTTKIALFNSTINCLTSYTWVFAFTPNNDGAGILMGNISNNSYFIFADATDIYHNEGNADYDTWPYKVKANKRYIVVVSRINPTTVNIHINGIDLGSKATFDLTFIFIMKSLFGYDDGTSLFGGVIEFIMYYKNPVPLSMAKQLSINIYDMFETTILSRPYLNFGSGGAPPAVTPIRKRSFIQISWWEEMMRNLGIG